MKRLGKIDVCGVDFDVLMGNSSDFEGLGAAYGECDTVNQEIRICEGMKPTKFRETLVHETLHGVIAGSGAYDVLASALGAQRGDPKLDSLEETLIRVLTPHLIRALASTAKLKA